MGMRKRLISLVVTAFAIIGVFFALGWGNRPTKSFAANDAGLIKADEIDVTKLAVSYTTTLLEEKDRYQINKDGIAIPENGNQVFDGNKMITIDTTPMGAELVFGTIGDSEDPGVENFRYAVVRKSMVDCQMKPLRRPHMGWWMADAETKKVKVGQYDVSIKVQVDDGEGAYSPQPWIEANWTDGKVKYDFFSRNVPWEEVLKMIEHIS